MLTVHRARRVLSAQRRGSSWPVVVETDAGRFLTKLRGAAQGTPPLVAEILVAALAEALGLRVPERALVAFDETLESLDRHEELLQLLAASRGLNLGFRWLEGAREIRPDEAAAVGDPLACAVLWLDALVLNRDRTARNPNVVAWKSELWLVDHGAALPFQYRWSVVTEASPRTTAYPLAAHLFGDRAPRLPLWDGALAARLPRPVLEGAAAEVPEDFLRPLARGGGADAILRRRRAYEAFLWKRLKEPRPFVAKPDAGRATAPA
jgi:hypothetical protein